ncbi:MAG: hypothetical protein RIQ59_759 [Bacteroidota bacterium]|jgi:hypothetical protein
MNKYKTTLLITLAALVTPLVTFSQLPGDFGDNTDPNPTDAPIDTNIWILLTVGCVYVGYKLYRRKTNKC